MAAIPPDILAQFCPLDGRKVIVLKDKDGNIGGYSVTQSVMDSPIAYFDTAGKPLASFHVFDSDENKASAMAAVQELNEKFPIQEPLVCPD